MKNICTCIFIKQKLIIIYENKYLYVTAYFDVVFKIDVSDCFN